MAEACYQKRDAKEMKLDIDIIAEGAIRDKKTSKFEAWFWSKVRNIFGDWCEDCGRPCGHNGQIHQCMKCYYESCERAGLCEHGEYLTEYCPPCGGINSSE